MTNYPLDIRLASEYITIGPVPLVPRGSPVEKLLQVLGQPTRVLAMSHEGVLINELYIYDTAGIRFWAKTGIIGELQLVFELEDRESFPYAPFVGSLEYERYTLTGPISGDLFTTGKLADFVQDTDQLQYNRIVYKAKKARLTYTALINSNTNTLSYISII